MTRKTETPIERDVTDAELDTVTGGSVRQPPHSPILINRPSTKPVFADQVA